MRILLLLTLTLASLASTYASDKTYFVRNTNEAEIEKEIIVIKEIGQYRIFKVCDLIAYLHNGKVDINNPDECQNIGNGLYKYNNADLLGYKKELEATANKYSKIDDALTTSSVLAGVYTFGQFAYKYINVFISRENVALDTLRANKKTYFLGTLFAVVTGYLAVIADDVEDENQLMASVLKTATEPVAPNSELKIDMTISDFISHLNELLLLGERAGTFQVEEIE